MPVTHPPRMIPELAELRQWVVWRREAGGKVPYQPSGARASTTDPSTWVTYQEADAARVGFDGIGFVFTEDDPYAGIDFDHVNDRAFGHLVKRLDSYTETSVSGDGLHTIVRAKLNGGRNRTDGFEVYDRGRFFVMTGEHVPESPTTIEDRNHELGEILREIFPEPGPASDQELLQKARDASNGATFSRLYDDGNTDGYGSPSEADLVLAGRLAFWTGGDAERIDRLFRGSALMRDKWDRDDYRRRTIDKAIASQSSLYQPQELPRAGDVWRTSWSPDLTEGTVIGPELMGRTDGEALLYVGKLHWFQGEPESGKTWAALAAVAEVLQSGRAALFVDFEDSRPAVMERLEAMGAPTEHFVYVQPTEALNDDAEADIERLMKLYRPSLVVLDGVNEAMAINGLDSIRAQDVASFVHHVLDRFRGPEITTIAIDHVARGEAGKGRYAYGSQHKLATVDGAAYRFEIVQPFSRAKGGAARIEVAKDRPGWVRSIALDKNVGVLQVVPGEVLSVTIVPALIEEDEDDLTYTQRRVYDVLPENEEGALTYSEIGDRLASDGRGFALKKITIRKALSFLEQEGLVDGVHSDGSLPAMFWKSNTER